ncbi:HEAT repeat family protein [Musa troglodytarum]|uniref:HEAT repeat family protein n=1 Tax=Musa troglodytarum TaxID=320322 RepID=A0A9E7EJU7_9LILI|nr:HEAT repeat family protein [Musa troglodytarum]
MEEALEMARAKDTKERMAGVERLHQVLEATTKSLSTAEVTALVDACMDLLKDSNFRVSQGALQALSAAAVLSGEHLKLHFNGLVPAVVERLGDGKQPVRDAARQLLITLMEVLQLLTDSNQSVREAATLCIEEMYAQGGPQFREELHRHHLPSSMLKEINARLEKIEPKVQPSDGVGISYVSAETRPSSANHKKSSPKTKMAPRETSFSSGDIDAPEKPVAPIKVYSEKELMREMEKIASTLVPEKDWSLRIAAMQRVESLVYGDYPSFPALLKQLVAPLSTQLLDRRSSIVKQACHLLNLLSKELLGDFEACAEMLIPIIVLKRCCEYALLILEYWADAPEIQRSADLYEDLIKCCVADAMSEIINEEDGGMHKRYASPSLRERGVQFSRAPSQASSANVVGYGTSAIVAMDKSATISTGTSLSSASLLSQSKTLGKSSERSLESVLHASKQKVSAIESLLKGVSISEKHNFTSARSTSLDLGVDAPSTRDPLVPSVSSPDLFSAQSSVLVDSIVANITKGSNRNGGSNMSEVLSSQVQQSRDPLKLSHLSHVTSDTLSSLSSSYMKRSSERLQEISGSEDNVELRLSRRLPSIHTDRQYLETPYKDSGYRDSQNSYIPNFQRPLLRKQVTGRTLASGRSSFDDSQIPASEMSSYMDGPASLNDALTEGLSPSSDWQGPKGILEITQNFEKVMKLFFRYLDDPHHKVAQAAFSTLAEIIPSCRKPFESYLERTLPHVFSRLIDPKELVRQPCSATLEIVGKTYNIDSLLPALLRSLDEQRSPKAKLAVIQFANNSFNKHTINADGYSNNGFLKLWLGKLAPLVNDKNVRLKETSISGIISVYSHFDPTAVLNFILSLSVEEQNSLRRALKQYTPRIEVDLMNFLQNKKERVKGYVGASKKSHHFGRYSAGSVDEGGKKWSLTHESTQLDVSIGNAATNESHHAFENIDDCGSDPLSQGTGSVNNFLQKTEMAIEHESSVLTPRLDISRLVSSDGHMAADMNHGGEISISSEFNHEKLSSAKAILPGDSGPSIPQLLHRICNINDVNSSSEKQDALQQLVEVSLKNDTSVWTKYFNQILTAVLEVLDDSDSSVRELALSLVVRMLNNQVSNEANQCLNIILSQFDPFRFLSVIVPLLISDDEKTLVICINCLTKLVGRLPHEDLMKHLPSFLPALFDAFRNQSPDVRKTVVFCLVEIYIMLGKSFLPYLEGLSSTQLRLVTIYANRISQARSGAPIDH